MLLNSLIALPDETFTTTPDETEVSRSVADRRDDRCRGARVQGTYVRQDPAPSIPKATTSARSGALHVPVHQGHMRAIPVASFATCSGAELRHRQHRPHRDQRAVAARCSTRPTGIPTATAAGCATKFNGSCRTVFTTLQSGRLPPMVDFTTTNAMRPPTNAPTNLGVTLASNLTGAERQTLISRILAGKPDGTGNGSRSSAASIARRPL